MNVRGRIKLFDEKEINKRIDKCSLKTTSLDIPVCKGVLEPCSRVIDKGKCYTIIEYFNELADEKAKACLDTLAKS